MSGGWDAPLCPVCEARTGVVSINRSSANGANRRQEWWCDECAARLPAGGGWLDAATGKWR